MATSTIINDFKGSLQDGGARANQFMVYLNIPGDISAERTTLRSRAASLPASTISNIETFYRGRPVNFAGERTFQPWTVTFFNDVLQETRRSLEAWQNNILNYNATNGLMRPADYYTDMEVHHLDRNNGTTRIYYFYDVYPTNISQITLAYDANNAIEEFDCEFTYNFFNVIDNASAPNNTSMSGNDLFTSPIVS